MGGLGGWWTGRRGGKHARGGGEKIRGGLEQKEKVRGERIGGDEEKEVRGGRLEGDEEEEESETWISGAKPVDIRSKVAQRW